MARKMITKEVVAPVRPSGRLRDLEYGVEVVGAVEGRGCWCCLAWRRRCLDCFCGEGFAGCESEEEDWDDDRIGAATSSGRAPSAWMQAQPVRT